jgi:hypothetical protein
MTHHNKVKLTDSFVVNRKPPLNLSTEDQQLFEPSFKCTIPSNYYYSLNYIYIVGDTIFSSTQMKFYVKETHLIGSKFSFNQKKKYLKKIIFSKHSHYDNLIWITMNWTEMYFHWLFDALSRLMLVEEFYKEYKVILPISYKKYSYVQESLKLLDFDVVYYNNDEVLKVKNLALPGHTAPTGNYKLSLIIKLKERLLRAVVNSIKKNQGKRIYISRSKAARRVLTNEIALYSLLAKFNIEFHCFEDYNLNQQIMLANSCVFMTGMHGAGFSNMIFMEPNSTILEIQAFNNHMNVFFSLASELNFNYYYLNTFANEKNELIIDIDKFEKLLNKILV